MGNVMLKRNNAILFLVFTAIVLAAPILLSPIGAGYPDILQKFAIFGIFAIGFNILFGLTGYLSFGHAAFLGVGSYTAVWMFKLLSMNPIPAVLMAMVMAGLFSAVIGYVCLRRSGIYFSILTLAFAQMSYNLAYSVLTPITNGETGLQLRQSDPRMLDAALGRDYGAVLPSSDLFGITMTGYSGFYFCAVMLIISFYGGGFATVPAYLRDMFGTFQVGAIYRSFPDSHVTEVAFQADLGFSFLLWSYR